MARPGFLHVPPYRTSAGGEVADLAESAGLTLDGWQRWVLEESLTERDDGKWTCFEIGLCCPRQNGKSAVLEAVMLGSLFLDGGETLYSAHEFKTTQKIHKRVASMVLGTPELKALVKRHVTSTNEMSLELFDGSLLQFVARSGVSGRGFSADRLIFDEAMILSSDSMTSMVPTMTARPNGQIWYAGSAGFAESEHWRSIRDRGRTGIAAGRLAWFEWGGDPVENIRDREVWAERNPGYPDRLSDEAVEAELETLETREETLAGWVRERLGVWDDPEAASRVFTPDLWASCVHDRVKPETMTFAVDVSPLQDWAAIAAAWVVDGTTHVEVTGTERLADHREGTTWVVPRLGALALKHGAHVAVAHGSQAAALIPDLERAGVTVDVIKSTDVTSACGAFYNLATDGRLAHHSQEPLDRAVANAQRKDVGDGAWIWGRRKSPVDITPLYAATLAAWQVGQPGEPEPAFYSWAQLQDDEEQ